MKTATKIRNQITILIDGVNGMDWTFREIPLDATIYGLLLIGKSIQSDVFRSYLQLEPGNSGVIYVFGEDVRNAGWKFTVEPSGSVTLTTS